MIEIAFGCGKKVQENVIGVDIVDFGWNKIADLEHDVLPFEDNYADLITMHNVVEHIPRSGWRNMFNEAHRILKPSGTLQILVPNGENIALAMADITHVSFFVYGTLKYLTGEKPRNADYGFKKWHVLVARDYVEKEPRVILAELRPNKE